MSTLSPKLYDELNKAWKSTCRILFGEEIGELEDFSEWTGEYSYRGAVRGSHVSGKPVHTATGEYCDGSRFVSADEIREASAPLDINRIKDLDSVLDALSERWEYSGNRMIGNCRCVDTSDKVYDSSYVSSSSDIKKSSAIFSSFSTHKSSHVFGSAFTDGCNFLVRSIDVLNATRCLEAHLVQEVSDAYFCYDCKSCHDILFSFHQQNKRYCIGNLELPKDKYLDIKTKLIGEIREKLKRTKKFPSLFKLVPDTSPDRIAIASEATKQETNVGPINKSFSSLGKILFQREIGGTIEDYEAWLSAKTASLEEVETPFGGRTYLPHKPEYEPYLSLFPKKRWVTYEEAQGLGAIHLDEADVIGLKTIENGLARIGFFNMGGIIGKNAGLVKCTSVYNVSNVYRGHAVVSSENVGVSSAVLGSKNVFGSHAVIGSAFCMKCYYSTELNRCFEVDSSTKCSDTYFAHNCEGLQDAMFCFNAKGKRHAIGNMELQPDQYKKIKGLLISQIADELSKERQLRLDIFNIGCRRK